MLDEMKKRGLFRPGRVWKDADGQTKVNPTNPSRIRREIAKDLGISRKLSSRAQLIARVPEPAFEGQASRYPRILGNTPFFSSSAIFPSISSTTKSLTVLCSAAAAILSR